MGYCMGMVTPEKNENIQTLLDRQDNCRELRLMSVYCSEKFEGPKEPRDTGLLSIRP